MTDLKTISIAVALSMLASFFIGACSSTARTEAQCRSKQSEAKTHLKALFVAEESYRVEYDTYLADFEVIGFRVKASHPRYKYEVVDATNTHFLARARGLEGEMPGDEWTINEEVKLINTKAGCVLSE